MPRTPRTDPYVRLSRIRLLPRVADGEALIGPRMADARLWKPYVGQLHDLIPSDPPLLAAAAERAPPAAGDLISECHERTIVGRPGVIVEVALDDTR